jgi:Zn-dependent protease
MRWSLRIACVAGIGIHVHATFPLLLIWAAVTNYLQRRWWADAVFAVAFVLILFGIIVLHELGHALAARRYGIPTRDITLLPIGGVARLDRIPEIPRQELVIAIAGPAVNVVLALLFFILAGGSQRLGRLLDFNLGLRGLFMNLMLVNLLLTAFNLTPAFPMDGGRILRALLAMRLSYLRATEIAVRVGQVFALIFMVLGYYNPFLIVIAFFVWVGATRERALVRFNHPAG